MSFKIYIYPMIFTFLLANVANAWPRTIDNPGWPAEGPSIYQAQIRQNEINDSLNKESIDRRRKVDNLSYIFSVLDGNKTPQNNSNFPQEIEIQFSQFEKSVLNFYLRFIREYFEKASQYRENHIEQSNLHEVEARYILGEYEDKSLPRQISSKLTFNESVLRRLQVEALWISGMIRAMKYDEYKRNRNYPQLDHLGANQLSQYLLRQRSSPYLNLVNFRWSEKRNDPNTQIQILKRLFALEVAREYLFEMQYKKGNRGYNRYDLSEALVRVQISEEFIRGLDGLQNNKTRYDQKVLESAFLKTLEWPGYNELYAVIVASVENYNEAIKKRATPGAKSLKRTAASDKRGRLLCKSIYEAI